VVLDQSTVLFTGMKDSNSKGRQK